MPRDPYPIEDAYPSLLLRALWTSKSAEQTARETNYIESMLDVDLLMGDGARLLDVPCGNGRIALELARRGHHVTGIDLAAAAIQRAQQDTAAHALKGSLAYRVGDMRDLPATGDFDGACCLWESFGYFDDDGNRAFLDALARALRPGGKLLLDTHVLESLLPRMARREWTELADGTLVLEERAYDHEASTMTRHWRVIADGQVEHSTLTIRMYSYRELVALLDAAGFTACTGYQWMSIAPFMPGTNRLVMVATRA